MEKEKIFSAQFNACRKKYDVKHYTRKELMNILTKEVEGFPNNPRIITIMVDNGAICKTMCEGTPYYHFTATPVHMNVLSECLEQMRKYYRDKAKEYRYKDVEVKLSEQSCIEFLKKKGYKIYKPITEFKEV